MDFIFDLMGRFHPLIVHLPIGFLLLGLMMLVFDRKENKHQKIIRFTFFWGTLSPLLQFLPERFNILEKATLGRIFRGI